MDADQIATLPRNRTLRGQRTARARSSADALSPDRLIGALPTSADDACPTCQACHDARLNDLPGATHPGVDAATCPTCGQTSLEFGLLLALDEIIGELHGLARLDAAL